MFNFIARLLQPLVGSITYEPPKWLKKIFSFHWLVKLLMLASVAIAIGLWHRWDTLFPAKPYYSIHSQLIASDFKKDIPTYGKLILQVKPPKEQQSQGQEADISPAPQPRVLIPEPETSLSVSAANLNLIGEESLNSYISLEPSLSGTWRWQDDKQLVFTPDSAWLPGTEYTISINPTVFHENITLSEPLHKVKTRPFVASIDSFSLYQPPMDLSVRRAVATLTFSHPVDASHLENYLSLESQVASNTISASGLGYTVEMDKTNTKAYITSVPLTIGDNPKYIYLNLNEGLKSYFKEKAIHKTLQEKLFLPDRYNFLNLENVEQMIVNDADGKPEKTVVVTFTDAVTADELTSKLRFYQLPTEKHLGGKRYWYKSDKLTETTLRNLKPLDYRLNPTPTDASKTHSAVVGNKDNTQIYMVIKSELSSVSHFKTRTSKRQILRMPNYPKKIEFMGDGAMMSRESNQTLTLVSRNLTGIQYSIHKINENELKHLITQTSGDIASPSFSNWRFNENNLGPAIRGVKKLRRFSPQATQYTQINLKDEVAQSANELGLFYVTAQGYDHQRKQFESSAVSRLILVTDIGLLVKKQSNDIHRVFVQSLSDGKPLVKAEVSIVSISGQTLFRRYTDADGHVKFPSTKGLRKDKTPTVFVVRYRGDTAFIPYNRYQRQLNLSRFDIGGQRNTDKDALKAMIMTDRGIYRPGETVQFASIIKSQSMNTVESIPLKATIRDPQYKIVKEQRFMSNSVSGLNEFRFKTPKDAVTGSYRVSIALIEKTNPRQLGTHSFKLEEFQPDSMAIKSQLLDAPKQGWITSEEIQAKVNLSNLYGLPAQNRKVTGKLSIQAVPFQFEQYPGYIFKQVELEGKNNVQVKKTLPQQTTNADGDAVFTLDVSQFTQGLYRLDFSTSGFEASGGKSVSASNSALLSPHNTMIGYKPDGDLSFLFKNSQRTVSLVAINANLSSTNYDNVTLKRYELTAIASLVKQSNGTYQYQKTEKREFLDSVAINIPETAYGLSLETAKGGKFVIDVEDDDGRVVASIPYTVVTDQNDAGKTTQNSELAIKLNKQDFAPGDNILVHIEAPYKGSGLITIEDDEIHAFKWFKTDKNNSLHSIEIPQYLEGNAYVNVSYVRSPDSPNIYSSPLVYGVAPFSIDKSEREIEITLDAPDIVRPGAPVEIQYATDKPSDLIVFAVDEGILQVADYELRDPLEHFLRKRALTVTTSQMLDLILPEFMVKMPRSAAGGGRMRSMKAMADSLNPFSRKQVAPAVFWSGILSSNGTKQSVSFTAPEHFSGKLRIMAIAVSDSSMGSQMTQSLVRGPFVLTPNQLTHVAPGDSVDVTLNVANNIKDSGENAKIAISLTPSEHFELESEATQTVLIDESSEASVTFALKVNQKLGTANLLFSAQYKNERSQQAMAVSIRPSVTQRTSLTIGQSNNTILSLDTTYYSELLTNTLQTSSSPLLLAQGLVHYLENFPHGCTEQIVSESFALVGLAKHPEFQQRWEDTREKVEATVKMLVQRQNLDGGFSRWPSLNSSHEETSLHAIHFLIETKFAGFSLPPELLENASQYLQSRAQQSSVTLAQARYRAQAIYLMTRLGNTTGFLISDLQNDLAKYLTNKADHDLLNSYIAASYQLLELSEKAESSLKKFDVTKSAIISRYDSQLSQTSQHMYLYAKHFASLQQFDLDTLQQLSDSVQRQNYNTLSAAHSALALATLDEKSLPVEPTNVVAKDGNGSTVPLDSYPLPFNALAVPDTVKNVAITSKQPQYYVLQQTGYSTLSPKGASSEGIEITKSLLAEDGTPITQASVGDEITVVIRLRASDTNTNHSIALVDLLPGGAEIVRRSVRNERQPQNIEYIDLRDDRYVNYLSLTNSMTEVRYTMKLAHSGDFEVPGAFAQDMYQIKRQGSSGTVRLKVIPDKGVALRYPSGLNSQWE